MDRRRLLLLAGSGLVTVVAAACGGKGGASATTAAATTADARTGTTTTAGAAPGAALECVTEIPQETGGPYPGDGSNGPNVLTESGIVRQDIRSSFGSASGTAEGVPLTIELTVVDAADGCTPLPGAAVYAWHCDRDGNYSLYSEAVAEENYLRGVQVADESGAVRFTSIYPGCYAGRWPHVHFEVYPTVDAATGPDEAVKTSQLAFPQDACETVYATSGYETSVSNLARLSLETDNVFGDDGGALQLATMGGSVDSGYTATLVVGV
ncbi:MAG: intradiol ring-cleavage dioxygenase [Thermoleophilia bacterium]